MAPPLHLVPCGSGRNPACDGDHPCNALKQNCRLWETSLLTRRTHRSLALSTAQPAMTMTRVRARSPAERVCSCRRPCVISDSARYSCDIRHKSHEEAVTRRPISTNVAVNPPSPPTPFDNLVRRDFLLPLDELS